MPPGSSGQANIRAYLGGSGTGKTASVRAYIRSRKPARLLVWDPLDEHGAMAERAPTLRDLVRLSTAARWRLRYVPTGAASTTERQFEVFCMVAWRSVGAVVYVEELGQVTTPSKAPPAWSKLCAAGRHQSLTIIGSAQRPAMIDKTFLGNATLIRTTGGFRYQADGATVAQVLRIPLDEVDELPPLHYVERDFVAGTLHRGKVKP
ncbi:MAG: hypothetical protein ACOYLX_00870 [Burkholderiaceae bacterium]